MCENKVRPEPNNFLKYNEKYFFLLFFYIDQNAPGKKNLNSNYARVKKNAFWMDFRPQEGPQPEKAWKSVQFF